MTSETVRARAVVAGRVQGVYFRQSTELQARATGVAGWVRNLDDGRVEAVFEGTREAVETMLEYVSHGPTHASVDSVETVWETPERATGFWIR
jgi:acylphosphatase